MPGKEYRLEIQHTRSNGEWVLWTTYDDRSNALARGWLLSKDTDKRVTHFRVLPLVEDPPGHKGLPGCRCLECDPDTPPMEPIRPLAPAISVPKAVECSACLGTICDGDGSCVL